MVLVVKGTENSAWMKCSSVLTIFCFRASRLVWHFADRRIGFLTLSLRASSFWFLSASFMRSILFSAVMVGTPAAPRRSMVSMQVLFFLSMVSMGSLRSKTRIIKSEKIVSSSVEWNASISESGRRSMKPTVSVRRNLRFENSTILVVVESVVNSDLSTRTDSVVNALNRVLFPELV